MALQCFRGLVPRARTRARHLLTSLYSSTPTVTLSSCCQRVNREPYHWSHPPGGPPPPRVRAARRLHYLLPPPWHPARSARRGWMPMLSPSTRRRVTYSATCASASANAVTVRSAHLHAPEAKAEACLSSPPEPEAPRSHLGAPAEIKQPFDAFVMKFQTSGSGFSHGTSMSNLCLTHLHSRLSSLQSSFLSYS
jgi:hypothetical protein